MAYRFENENGDVIEVETEAAANEYRQREGFTEVGGESSPQPQPSQSPSDDES